ncbi:sirohydrochlorin chelatase [Rhizomonospora bruguierae]|uniref:sirohydrochlorin chelatase n=1 Tax=Rhizomonospora bruguierae TaxID=1581705 RepID=UPI0020C09B73|nr:CbiX/SirB N-terminal domain-containing protein [Micromonospora sp. NBRC 107566]
MAGVRTAGVGHPAPVVLVAHGSRDPAAASATRALVRAVAAARPGLDVRASYLDHTVPRPEAVLAAVERAGAPRATLVPLLLTSAFHGRVDIPRSLADARAGGLRLPVHLADVLGPVGGAVPAHLVAALRRRVAALNTPYDSVVLAAAGTRDAAARRTVAQVATALGEALDVPCEVAYASASAPTGAEAVEALRARGARRVVAAAYFLAPGRLYATVMGSARSAGALACAEPLTDARELAALVLARADAAR